MRDVLPFLLEHGYAVLFACVLAEQAGAPIPAAPVLLGVGALAGAGRMPLAPGLALAVVAALIIDSLWYWLGRRRGISVLRVLCAVSLEPDSCVSTTRRAFERIGAPSLLIAKFVPGLSTAAPPMAGVTGMAYWRFLVADGLGAMLWSGAFMALGWMFRHQFEALVEGMLAYGSRAGFLMGALLAGYVSYKLWQRERFLHALRVARVSPETVLDLIQNGDEVLILDLRNRLDVQSGPGVLPGAVWHDPARLEEVQLEIPRDRDIILYCS